MRLRDVGEVGFLRSVQEALGGSGGAVRVGIGDDAAVIECPAGECLVLTCDAAVEGRHFRREWLSPSEIGGRAVRCALSDFAAMGARPAAVLLTLVVSPAEEATMAQVLVKGAAQAAEAYGARLVGGETVGNQGPLTLDVVAAGFVPVGRELRRSGAGVGDALLVSGTLGDSAAGLAALEAMGVRGDFEAVIARYIRPEPRTSLGALLAECEGVRAAIDISDGLVRDAGHLAEQSGVGIVVLAEALPLSPECRAAAERLSLDPLQWALAGGEDFELLFAADAERAAEIVELAQREAGVTVTVIGEVVEGRGVTVVREDGAEIVPPSIGWDQFAD